MVVFPALAGMNRVFRILDKGLFGIPRASGDEPPPARPALMAMSVFPALAGMTLYIHRPFRPTPPPHFPGNHGNTGKLSRIA